MFDVTIQSMRNITYKVEYLIFSLHAPIRLRARKKKRTLLALNLSTQNTQDLQDHLFVQVQTRSIQVANGMTYACELYCDFLHVRASKS